MLASPRSGRSEDVAVWDALSFADFLHDRIRPQRHHFARDDNFHSPKDDLNPSRINSKIVTQTNNSIGSFFAG